MISPVSERLEDIYRRLYAHYGPQHWWPGETRFEMMVGAILTQSAAWTNADKAIDNLKEADALSPSALRERPLPDIAELIHPCGYFNVKARKLREMALWLERSCRDDLDALFSRDTGQLRRELLGVWGIGEETADSILLYAAGKPVFVIDAYTRRILGRIGITPEEDTYAAYQALFTDNVPADVVMYNEYHALLVRLGKEACRSKPRCSECCLGGICGFLDGGGNVG